MSYDNKEPNSTEYKCSIALKTNMGKDCCSQNKIDDQIKTLLILYLRWIELFYILCELNTLTIIIKVTLHKIR